MELNVQTVSNKKYLKLYRIKSNLIENYETSSLKILLIMNTLMTIKINLSVFTQVFIQTLATTIMTNMNTFFGDKF